MKMNFNGNEFNASINSSSAENHSFNFEKGKKLLSENSPLILAILSSVLAIINLPFGLFMNISTKVLSDLIGSSLPHWIFALFVVTSVIIALSILCGVFAIILFTKTKKVTLNYAGLVLAILSFILCAVCLGLSIAGIVAW